MSVVVVLALVWPSLVSALHFLGEAPEPSSPQNSSVLVVHKVAASNSQQTSAPNTPQTNTSQTAVTAPSPPSSGPANQSQTLVKTLDETHANKQARAHIHLSELPSVLGRIKLSKFPTKCLEVNGPDIGATVRIADCAYNNAEASIQHFQIRGHQIAWGLGSQCVEVKNGNEFVGATLQLNTCDATSANQQFLLDDYVEHCNVARRQGAATITDMRCSIKWCRLAKRNETYDNQVANCNRCLDPHHGGYALEVSPPSVGEPVELWDCYGSPGQDNQDWLFERL